MKFIFDRIKIVFLGILIMVVGIISPTLVRDSLTRTTRSNRR